MNEYKYPITIFTPTYNRSYIIDNLYQSLCEQSYSNFEWLIIDQGNDDTHIKIEKYQLEKKLKCINYIKCDDRVGINRALNDAIDIAKGCLIFKVDDDDYLTSDAIESIMTWVDRIPPRERGQFAGVSGLRAYHDGNIIGGQWKNKTEYIDCTSFERKKYSLQGDKAEAYFTDVLKRYGPLPEFDAETLTFESMIYDRIAAGGLKVRWYNKIIYYTEYLSDGQTMNTKKKLSSNLNTYAYLINNKILYKTESFWIILKNMCRYCEMCRKKNMTIKDAGKHFTSSRWIYLVCWRVSKVTRFL